MGYNQFSKVVEPRPYTPEIDVDVYGKGLLMNEQNMKNTQQNLNNAADSFLNIQTNIPQDAQVLNQRKQEFQTAVKDLNLSNLNNPQTVSQLNQLITKFSNDQDILGIAQRANSVNKELQTKKEYESKGQVYRSPLLRQAEKYIGGNAYLRDERFNKSGFVAAPVAKMQEDLMKTYKDVIVRKEKKLGADGRIYTTNVVDGNKAADLWKSQIENDPNLRRLYEDQFEELHGDRDWNTEGQQMLTEAANRSYQLAGLASTPEEKQYYLDKAETQERIAGSKYSGEQMKKSAFQEFLNQDAKEFGEINNVLNIEDIDADAFKLEGYRTANNLYEYGEKLKMDAGDYSSKGIPAKQESSNKIVYSITGEPTSAGAAYNTLKSAFEGKEVGLNDLAPKIAKAKNIDYDPKRMKAIKNEDGTISLQEAKVTNRGKSDEKTEWKDVPNTKTDLNGAVGLWGGADKKSYDQFIGGLNKTKEQAAIQYLTLNGITNPTPAQIAETVKAIK